MRETLISLCISLFLTWVLESIAYLFVRKKCLSDYLVLLLVNAVTNPVVVLISVSTSFSGAEKVLLTAFLELSAVTVEWLLYKHCAKNITKPFLFSLFANAFSYFTGLILQLL